jgi:hypothetical protein
MMERLEPTEGAAQLRWATDPTASATSPEGMA